tara:strand:+ start:426 stop:896 length:471 start_codon:yes stop_codon:yes gene_type:complete
MNKLAIKDKASEEYDVSLVMPDQLMTIWKDIEKYLNKSSNRSNGRTTTQDVFYECLNSQSSLWIIFDTGNMNITGCLITQINKYPTGKKMLNIDHIGGKNMKNWINRGIEVMEKWAKDNKCNGLEGVGRQGFWNWVKDKNWKKTAIFVEYNFKDIQ